MYEFIFIHNLYVRSTCTFTSILNEISFIKIQGKHISFKLLSYLAKNYIKIILKFNIIWALLVS